MKRLHTIVFGGTYGGGRALTRLLAREGHRVSILGRRRPAKKDLSARVRFWPVDLADREALLTTCRNLVAESGKPDSLAFYQRYRGAGDAWTGEWDVSLSATRAAIETLAPQLATGGPRSIVIVGSVATRMIAEEQSAAYHLAKAGLAQLSRYYAATLGRSRVRVNVVSPGTVLKDESAAFYRGQPALLRLYRDIVPLGRMGTAEEVSQVVSFLLSAKASYVTGQEIVVDGGLSLLWQESLARKLVLPKGPKMTRKTPRS